MLSFGKVKRIIPILLLVILFALLLFKDPFSQRTLIPNFEPYPDTFYYISPALNLINGQGFNIGREGRVFKANVPPLYSFSLIPAYIFNNDPRMAYYSNVVLALVSLLFFWLILRKITTKKIILYSLLILYTTNYFIYWVPTIIMSENLMLVLFLASFYFLLSKTTIVNSFIVAFLSMGIYATKFSSFPVAASIILIFIGKILLSGLVTRQKVKLTLLFIFGVTIYYSVLGVFLAIAKDYYFILQILINLSFIRNSIPKEGTLSESTDSATWFGVQYIKQNLPLYINSLIGNPNRFLWDYTPLVPKMVAIGGIIGILLGIFNRKFRFISLMLLVFILSLVIFQSTFYSFDARYIYIAIPSLLIGLSLLLTIVRGDMITKSKVWIFNLLIFVLMITYLISSFMRIKSQISLNLRYAETPWNYIAILKTNEFFSPDKIKDSKRPILISALPPFLIDYYSNGNYSLLPLSYEQEFRGQDTRQIIWGPNDYSNLPKLYKKYLYEGYEVFVSRAGLGNESYTNKDFNTIIQEFDVELVQPGCFDQCNIYRVKLKTINGK